MMAWRSAGPWWWQAVHQTNRLALLASSVLRAVGRSSAGSVRWRRNPAGLHTLAVDVLAAELRGEPAGDRVNGSSHSYRPVVTVSLLCRHFKDPSLPIDVSCGASQTLHVVPANESG